MGLRRIDVLVEVGYNIGEIIVDKLLLSVGTCPERGKL